MPYITEQERQVLLAQLQREGISGAMTSGQLNFTLTKVVNDYVRIHKLDYKTINDVIGALESAKLEFYRRVVSIYEDDKIKKNGDVYGSAKTD